MKTHVLKGTKQEIAANLALIRGVVREAIVFEDEPAAPEARSREFDDFFSEMHPFMVDVSDVDDSREAIYSLLEGE